MSVHEHGSGWQVKWRDADGRQRGRSFRLKGDADLFDASVVRAKALGGTLLQELTDAQAGGMTLRAFVADEFKSHLAAKNLSRRTREQYEWALNLHLAELASEPLRALDVPRLNRHVQFLLGHPTKPRSAHTVRASMTALGGVLQVAVAHGHLQGNPVRAMPKAKADPKPEIDPLSPVQVEAIIAALHGRYRIVAVLGGRVGLRPREIRLVEWDGFDGEYLRVGRQQTKRTAEHGARTIRLDSYTAHELKLWRLAGGRGTGPIVGEWSEYAMKMYWQRAGKPAARTATGRDDVILYLLRHSHASALHYIDGITVPAAAKRMGHGPALHLQHYAHVVDALDGKPKFADLDALVASAQAELADGWQPEEATG